MQTKKTISARRSRSQGGSVIVEFALSFFLIFWTFSGLFEFGYVYYAYNNIVNAVRNGARYASNLPYSSTTTTPDSTYSTNVTNMVVYGTASPANGAQPVVSGLATSNVSITMTSGGTGTLSAPTAVTLSVTGFSLNAVFGTISISSFPKITFPYTGILTPPSS